MNWLNPAERLAFPHETIDVLVLRGERDDPIAARRSGRKRVGSNAMRCVLDGNGACNRNHAPLCGRVAIPPAQRHECRVRGCVDDRAAAGCDEMRNAVLASQERPEKVYTNRTPELFLRRIGHPRVCRPRTAGIIIYHVKRAEPVDAMCDGALYAVDVSDIALHALGFSANRANQFHGLLRASLIEISDDDLGTLLSEENGGGSSLRRVP